MKMKNGNDVPIGLGMALMEYPMAYVHFAQMSGEEQEQVLKKVAKFRTPGEMKAFAAELHRSMPPAKY